MKLRGRGKRSLHHPRKLLGVRQGTVTGTTTSCAELRSPACKGNVETARRAGLEKEQSAGSRYMQPRRQTLVCRSGQGRSLLKSPFPWII